MFYELSTEYSQLPINCKRLSQNKYQDILFDYINPVNIKVSLYTNFIVKVSLANGFSELLAYEVLTIDLAHSTLNFGFTKVV